MAIQELSEEQIHSMTVEEKDDWWLRNVYKGHMPQLTVRSALTGGGIFWSVSLLAVLSARQPRVICGKTNDATRASGTTSVSSSKLLQLGGRAGILGSQLLAPED